MTKIITITSFEQLQKNIRNYAIDGVFVIAKNRKMVQDKNDQSVVNDKTLFNLDEFTHPDYFYEEQII